MTQKEFYKMVADGQLTEEVRAYAQDKVDAEIEKSSAKAEANKAIIDALMANLSSTPQTVFDLTAKVEAECGSTTWQKVSTVLRGLVSEGKVEVGQMVSDRNVRNVYTLA